MNIIGVLYFEVLILAHRLRFYYPEREFKDKVNMGKNSWDQTEESGKIIYQLFHGNVFFAF